MMRTRRAGIGYAGALVFFALIWSVGFPIGKLAVSVAPPELFLATRFALAGSILFAWAAWRGDLRRPVPWLRLIGLGVINFSATNGLVWGGMQTVSAGLATIIVSVNPLLTALLAAAMLGDHLGPRRLAGLLLGIGGVIFVVRNRIVIGGEDPVGIAMIVVSLASQVGGIILFKWWSPREPLAVVVGVQQMGAALVLAVVGLATEQVGAIQFGHTLWWTLAYSTILNSIIAFLLWFYLLRAGSVTSVTSIQFTMPPLGLFFSWVLLGERIAPLDLVGLIPIALGIWLTTRPQRRATAA